MRRTNGIDISLRNQELSYAERPSALTGHGLWGGLVG